MVRTHYGQHDSSCFGCKLRTISYGMEPLRFQPHYNYTVGQYVSSMDDFKEKLKQGGEIHQAEYVPVDPREQPIPYPDHHDAFEARARSLHDNPQ